jgi:hypothetical protein
MTKRREKRLLDRACTELVEVSKTPSEPNIIPSAPNLTLLDPPLQTQQRCHCERSKAIPGAPLANHPGDCFVALLLAMTNSRNLTLSS